MKSRLMLAGLFGLTAVFFFGATLARPADGNEDKDATPAVQVEAPKVKRLVSLAGVEMDPRKIVAVDVKGLKPFKNRFCWEKKHAETYFTGEYHAKISELYTEDGYLVIKWNVWPMDQAMYEDDMISLVNLSQVKSMWLSPSDKGRYNLSIDLQQTATK